MSGPLRLRHAVVADLDVLLGWQRQPHIIEAGIDEDWGWAQELPRRPPWREQLIAELHGRPIGFVQIIDARAEETHYWGDVERGARAIDIWIGAADALGRGHGSAMMREALARCFAVEEVPAVLVDPLARNRRAHRFYRRFGFRFLEARRFGRDDCHVHRLARADWQAAQA